MQLEVVLEALGVTHLVEVDCVGKASRVEERSDDTCSLGHILVTCENEERSRISPEILQHVTNWGSAVRKKGGRVLISSQQLWQPSLTSKASIELENANNAVLAFAVALLMDTAGFVSLYDGVLAARSAFAHFSLNPETAADIVLWLEWRKEHGIFK